MELTPLRYFAAVARAGHMTRAAAGLGISQPALSAAIKRLEREVRTPLLRRGARGVELTPAGRVFLAHAEDAVRRADAGMQAVRELLGLEAGEVRIGSGATATGYVLPEVVSRVRAAHPALRFYIREAGSTQIAAAVASGELDLGIVTLPVKSMPGTPQAELVKIPLLTDELRLIVPEGHPLAGERDGFRWKDLEGQAFVAFEAGSAVREVIDAGANRAGVALRVVMELRSIESIRQMVHAGVGVALVSRLALGGGEGLACRQGRLTRELAIVRRRVGNSPAAEAMERALLAWARGALAKRAGAGGGAKARGKS